MNSKMSINITVKDRKGEEIVTLQGIELGMTVYEFKKLFLRDCQMASAKKLNPDRLRFTVNEVTGAAMSDDTKDLTHYIAEPMWLSEGSVTLYYKDLGPQIGWKAVFYIEYAGPIAITLLLMALRLTVW